MTINFRILFLLLSTCIVTISCKKNNNNNIIIDKFPETKYIIGKPVKEVDFFSKSNVYMNVVDSFLVVQRREEKMISIFSTNTHKLLTEIGTRGRGPNEFIFPQLTNQVSYDSVNKSPLIHIFDYERINFTQINILNAIKKSGNVFITENLSEFRTYFYRFFYKDDSLLLAKSEGGKGRFFHHDYKNSKTKIIPYLPKQNFPIKDNMLETVYRSTSVVNKERGLIASAPSLLGQIDFFDLSGNYIKSSVFENSEDNKRLKKRFAKGQVSVEKTDYYPKNHIVQVKSKNGKIYGLNYNNAGFDLYNNNKKSNLKVQIFDWDGKAIKEYIFNDNYFISSFAVDLNNNRIYGYCPNQEKYPIISYALKD